MTIEPIGPFLLSHLKELDYRDPFITESDFVARVHSACTFGDTTLLQRVQSAIPLHAHSYIDMRDGYFEYFPS